MEQIKTTELVGNTALESFIEADSPKVSVIVPVYKVEKYLPACIESILAQTFTDFELILVDDGSPDSSGKICDYYAARDSRIRVFHKENGGVSSARNLGIDNARGKWISFVDSDDWVESCFLEEFFIEEVGDLQVQGHKVYDTATNTYFVRENFPSCFCSYGERAWATIESADLLNSTGPVCKIFRREIVLQNRIYFPEDFSLGEDAVFVLMYWKYVRSFRLISKERYFYRKDCVDGNFSLCRRTHPEEELILSSKCWGKAALELLCVWGKEDSSYGKDILSTANYRHRTRAVAQVFESTLKLKDKFFRVKRIFEGLDVQSSYFPRSFKGKLFKFILVVFLSVF